MKKQLLTLCMALVAVATFAASEWIDVTDVYVVNPRFDNNDRKTGWEGTEFGAFQPFENAEFYERNYDAYQVIRGLKPGKYRISLSAFYRMGSSDQDYNNYKSQNYAQYQQAVLYAHGTVAGDEKSVRIVPLSSAALQQSLGGSTDQVQDGFWWSTTTYYLPGNMEAAHYWFEAGKYKNSVEYTVGDDGEMTIGIRKKETYQYDWTCLDNWKLEYWGEPTLVTSVVLSQTSLKLVPYETATLTASVLPENATHTTVTWSSSNTKVATVNSKTGEISAVGTGSCTITAKSKDNGAQSGQCVVTVAANPVVEGSIIINEIMASNIDVYLDPSFNFGSWVELYNSTDQSIALSGLYVSDDPNNLKKHQLITGYDALPAKGYAVLNFDHYEVWTRPSYRQIDDKLDCDGGTIIISDGTKIFAQQDYPAAISRTSYARTTDGGNVWRTTGTPTPGSSNNVGGGFADVQLDAPIVDKNAQLFTGTLQVCVNIPQGATLRYTTDGTAPTLTNGQISDTGLFSVTETTCFRFRLFKNGYLPSQVVTRSYIQRDWNDEPFPIISIVTDDNNLNSVAYGLFQKGPNGRTGFGPANDNEKKNWNMDWDRPVSFEYLTTDGECVVSQECDFAMCGGWSRAWTPHSFKLKASKAYDFNNFFKAQFFEKKPYIKNKTLQIRNGGNDTGCRFIDAAMQTIIAHSGLNVDYQSWQPVHVYINGQDYAVLNMREPNNKHFAYANYGIDTDEMDQFEINPVDGYVQMVGTDDAFQRLMELSKNAADENTYAEIRELLDIDEYINYMAIELYAGGDDWPQNNVKGFRNSVDGKFRFVLFDLDFTLNTSTPFNTFFNKQHYTFDPQRGYDYSQGKSVEQVRKQGEIAFVTLFKNMLQNPQFRKQFIDSYCIVGGSVFQPERVAAIVNKAKDYLAKGKGLGQDWYRGPEESANKLINGYNNAYNGNLINQLKNCADMKLSSTQRQLAHLSANVEEARITLNGQELPYAEFNGYLFAPVTLKAVTPAGYRFVGWTGTTPSKQSTLIATGSTWKYYDSGSLDGKAWKSISYSDTSWKSGKAPIGYGKNQNTSTAVNLPCYYFRQTINLATAPVAGAEFTLNFTVDDGMIVYVNGVEAGRYNMPSGNASYNTFASTYAPGNPDTGSLTLKSNLFKKGNNVIAVEVHNNSTSSTDILWSASLILSTPANSNGIYVSTEAEYTLPTSGTQSLMANFEKVDDDKQATQRPVRINEVSAANSIYINDYYKKNDWIELYNTTGKDIDLKGMYISDNANKPEKFQVPSDNVTLNTILPAHGYKVIWCDKLDPVGADIHTTFKLAAEGGDVLITTKTYADTLSYAAHTGMQTFGRYPDGSDDTYVMNVPTIAKANHVGSADTLYGDSLEPQPDDIRAYTKDGGITIAFVDGTINVKSEDSPIRMVDIYNTSGIKMAADTFPGATGHFLSLRVGILPRGIYVVRATTEAGDECQIKILIK